MLRNALELMPWFQVCVEYAFLMFGQCYNASAASFTLNEQCGWRNYFFSCGAFTGVGLDFSQFTSWPRP